MSLGIQPIEHIVENSVFAMNFNPPQDTLHEKVDKPAWKKDSLFIFKDLQEWLNIMIQNLIRFALLRKYAL